jgi:restriction system protein
VAIPDYEMLMLPVLKAASGGGEIGIRDCIDRLANEFNLSEAERQELLPSGKQTTFANRVHWARSYLVQAGLLEATRRAHFVITERGRVALSKNPPRIDNRFLLEFPEFQAFKTRRKTGGSDGLEESLNLSPVVSIPDPVISRATPEELIDAAHQEITDELRSALLERIVAASPTFFEGVVLDLLVAMGYGGSRIDAAQRVGRTGDGGIDGIINEDPLGLDIVYLQAKRYAPGNTIGIGQVREFAGSLVERGATKGVFVTTSHFVAGAKTYVDRIPQRLILIDGDELTRLMVRFGVGVRVERTIDFKRLDLDYFDEDELGSS